MKIRVELTEDLTKYGKDLVVGKKDMLQDTNIFIAEVMIILLQQLLMNQKSQMFCGKV